MPIPIRQEHELICPNCACVLGQADDYHNEFQDKPLTSVSPNTYLLGTILDKNVKTSSRKSPQQCHEEETLRKIEYIVKKYDLPDSLILDTFNQLKRNKRGFQSKTEPIKQLIKILSKDDYFMHINKLRILKKRFEDQDY